MAEELKHEPTCVTVRGAAFDEEDRCDCGAEYNAYLCEKEAEAKARARHDYQVAIGEAEPIRKQREERILDGVIVLGGIAPDGSLQLLGVDQGAPGGDCTAKVEGHAMPEGFVVENVSWEAPKVPEKEEPWPLPAWAGEQLAEHHRMVAERTLERMRDRGQPIPPELGMTPTEKQELATIHGVNRIGPKIAQRLPNYVTQPVPPDVFSETPRPIDTATGRRVAELDPTDKLISMLGVPAAILFPEEPPCVDCGQLARAHPWSGCGAYR